MVKEMLVKQLNLLSNESIKISEKGDQSALIGISRLMIDMAMVIDKKDVLVADEAADYCGMKMTCFRTQYTGKFLQPAGSGGKKLYRKSALLEWMDQIEEESVDTGLILITQPSMKI